MNCKQGDLALIVAGEDSGKVVCCIKWLGHHEMLAYDNRHCVGNDVWQVEVSPYVTPTGAGTAYISDSVLRPIRGEPETVYERQEVEA